MQKIIVSLDLQDDGCKQKVMKSVSGISGVDLVSIDMKDKKLTVIGDVDAILIVKKLRRHCHVRIDFVGPAKEPEKKKEEPKKSKNPPANQIVDLAYRDYNPHLNAHYYDPHMTIHYQSIEENPNACVIC
ncbi:heavy metal-associated isoprenylated plant protein 39-like [Papaver somniferum]|uniref:heavy metal-associated isoprenylated plant protein 39-like n=1 Tax=Papaver somniferum TaxID=3469 RepID=UPI000E6FA4E0|nr:heavy metal-associated isoprenylated plant protein 39-like [Papaver somniferum]